MAQAECGLQECARRGLPSLGVGPGRRVWESGLMTESESAQSALGAQADGDALAARLLAVQRTLCGLDVDPEARMRLHLRFMAICTSLKMPGASQVRGAERLDRLMADAERAHGGGIGGSPDRGTGTGAYTHLTLATSDLG